MVHKFAIKMLLTDLLLVPTYRCHAALAHDLNRQSQHLIDMSNHAHTVRKRLHAL